MKPGAVQEDFFTTEYCCSLDSLEFHGEMRIILSKLRGTPVVKFLLSGQSQYPVVKNSSGLFFNSPAVLALTLPNLVEKQGIIPFFRICSQFSTGENDKITA